MSSAIRAEFDVTSRVLSANMSVNRAAIGESTTSVSAGAIRRQREEGAVSVMVPYYLGFSLKRSMARRALASFMNNFQIRPVRTFSIARSIGPTSIPRFSSCP